MPTYEYLCQACGQRIEKYQSITARPIRLCPACGRLQLKRLVGAGSGVLFRGSGFYQTDYRSASYNKAAKAEQEGSSDGKKSKQPGKPDGCSSSESTDH
ncbi:MAG: FmdB family zinc ribbon protein [Phycisphaerae bacterium]